MMEGLIETPTFCSESNSNLEKSCEKGILCKKEWVIKNILKCVSTKFLT